jgi:hypothetical protein
MLMFLSPNLINYDTHIRKSDMTTHSYSTTLAPLATSTSSNDTSSIAAYPSLSISVSTTIAAIRPIITYPIVAPQLLDQRVPVVAVADLHPSLLG